MKTQRPPQTDEAIAGLAIAALREHGSMRLKPLCAIVHVHHKRLGPVLTALAMSGRLHRVADGQREGSTVYLYEAICEDVAPPAAPARAPISFNAAATLAAFQATAQRFAMGFAPAA
ncbi:hypothetical protein [Paraburkholderia sp. C35]|uniref:hypothetical protein n=1 Tax=Paraburkholderia sp. C35 TaxID=2126993 RepID=UPI0013A5A7BB|nr:hypothetical protein [Paraburkholderia sp. C35]